MGEIKYYVLAIAALLLSHITIYGQCNGGSFCQICQVDLTITSISGGTVINGVSVVNGSINGGQTGVGNTPLQIEITDCGEISMEVELDFRWDQGSNSNWIHGVSFASSAGWSAAEGVLPDPNWLFRTGITGVCSASAYGAGYYYDPIGTNCPPFGGGSVGNRSSWDGSTCDAQVYCEGNSGWLNDDDPSDNWGVDCEYNCPEFGFELRYCPLVPGNNTEEISFFLTDDAETGGWFAPSNCIFTINFPIEFISAGTQLRDTLFVCENECIDLDPGSGCDTYEWSTGAMTQIINVCPLVETDYYVTTTSTSGCEIIDTVKVIPEFCCEAEAGMLTDFNVCPGVSGDIVVTGYQTEAVYDQYIIIFDQSGIAIEVIMGDMTTLNSDTCAIFTVMSYNHYTMDASIVPAVGQDISIYDCSVECCDTEVVTVSFEDDEAPTFDSPPDDENLDCVTELATATSLSFTDNCLMPGSVDAVETGTADLCDGGTITRTWTAIDSCDNETVHTQEIVIEPIEPPVFINVPADMTFDCDYTVTTPAALFYENGLSGVCEIAGSVPGTQTGTHDVCGGEYTVTWEYTDVCNNLIEEEQTITIDPAPEATWTNPPGAITIECDEVESTYPDLSYDNGETGICAISGSESPVTVFDYDVCGGTITNTWTFTDECLREISVEQVITVNPAPIASFQGTLPASTTVDCDDVPASHGDLTASNGETGTCSISEDVSPTVDDQSDICGGFISYTWDFTDECDRNINYQQVITINAAPAPTYTSPPADITVDCDNIPSSTTSLDYTNGLSGGCALSGSTESVLSAFDICTSVITESWDDVDACGNVLQYEREITIESVDDIAFTSPPASTTLACEDVPSTFSDLTYTNNASGPCLIEGEATPTVAGSYDVCGGTLIITWQADDGCGHNINVSQTITVEPADAPVFAAAPEDVTVSCSQVPSMTSLSYSNGSTGNCQIAGNIPASQEGTYTSCGGNITYVWEYTDDCGYTITEEQQITINPAPAASFINPPADITVDCADAASVPNTLDYSNNQSSPCLISGTVSSINTGSYDLCGGEITQNWSFDDPCHPPIVYTRVITVNPANNPIFVTTPADITLACGAEYTAPEDLLVTNNESGVCGLNTSVSATVVQSGIDYIHTWEYTNPCDGTLLTYEQTVTESPFPAISIDPAQINICVGEAYELALVDVVDANGTSITLTYYEGNPISPGNQLFNTTVSPTASTLYTIVATNEYGCTDEAIFSIIVDEYPNAGEDGETNICDNITLNLFNFLGNSYDLGGVWLDVESTGINLEDPTSVVFNGLPPGSYDFNYVVSSGNTCPDDEATVTVTFNQLGELVVDSVFCTGSNDFYTVVLQDFGYSVLPNFGEVESQSNGITTIINIPIGNTVTINFFDPSTFCASFLVVNPPDCDCPQVPAPTGIDNTICASEAPGAIGATAVAGTTLNWYDVASGGTPLLVNSDTYLSPETTAGIYEYYVEAESIEFPGCVSGTRTLVTLTITASPAVNSIPAFEICLSAGEIFDINFPTLNSFFNSNPNNSFEYFETPEEAEAGTGEITNTSISISTVFYVKVSNTIGCFTIRSFEYIIHPNPIISFTTTDETCFGEDDGTVTISVMPSSGMYTILVDDVNASGNTIIDLEPGEHTIEVYDQETLCSTLDTFEIGPGVQINNVTLLFECDDNESDTNPDDDFYTLEFEFTSTNGDGDEYEIYVGGDLFGTYEYDELHTFTIPTSTETVLIEIIDTESGCTWNQMIGPLNPCSTNCSLTVNSFIQGCSDNDSPSDPSDDLIFFTINVSAINGSASNTYNVLINAIPQYTFNYDEDSSFSLNADGTTPSILIVDAADVQCSIPITSLPLEPCSDDCLLTISDFDLICGDNGTEDIIIDDFYTLTIDVDILNGASNNQVNIQIDDNTSTIFTIGAIVIDLPADELSHVIYISDTDSLACLDSIEIGPLDPCSSNCSLNINYFEEVCSDGGTPYDPTDDVYTFTWQISSIEGSPDSMYLLYVDNIFIDFYEYSVENTYTLPADGLTHSFEFVDVISEFCNEELVTSSLTNCSPLCQLTATLISVDCDNNGSNNIDIDDLFYVTVELAIINGSNSWQYVENGMYYPYLEPVVLGPFNIIDGEIAINIIDSLNTTCPYSYEIIPPFPCSECVQIVEAGNDQVIDCDKPSAELIGISSSVGMYRWTGPLGVISNDSIASANTQGWYYFLAIFDDGCEAVDSLYIEAIGEIPIAIAGPDSMLTCLTNSIDITGQYIGNSQDISYEWRDSDGNIIWEEANITITISGLYSFEIIDNETGCVSEQDDVFIGLDIEEPEAIIYADPGNVLNCLIELITLSPEEADNTVYEWISNGESTFSTTYEITSTGTIILVAIDTVTGCLASDSIYISELVDFPIINIDPYETLTCDNVEVILSAANSIPANTTIFNWYDSDLNLLSTDSEYSASDEGIYIVEVQDTVTGCINFDTLQVDLLEVYPQLINAEDGLIPCDENSINVSANVVDPESNSFVWSTINGTIIGASTSATITGTEGLYFVEISDLATGCSIYDTVVINAIENNVNILGLDAQNETCLGEQDGYVNWTEIIGGEAPYQVFLNDVLQTDTDIIDDLTPGQYELLIIDSNGCVFEEVFTIEPGSVPNAYTEPTISIEQGQAGQIFVETSIPTDSIANITWEPSDYLSCVDCLDPFANPPNDQTYTVTITDINGCQTTTTVTVQVRQSVSLYVPNTFTPNNDGVNDVFTIFSNTVEEIQLLRIYNRWGELVFENANFPPNALEFGWDGTFKGKTLNPAVFGYYANVKMIDGTERVEIGDVTIIK